MLLHVRPADFGLHADGVRRFLLRRAVGKNLQAQYERWQPKAKYKTHLDPTVDDVKKLAQSCRCVQERGGTSVGPLLSCNLECLCSHISKHLEAHQHRHTRMHMLKRTCSRLTGWRMASALACGALECHTHTSQCLWRQHAASKDAVHALHAFVGGTPRLRGFCSITMGMVCHGRPPTGRCVTRMPCLCTWYL